MVTFVGIDVHERRHCYAVVSGAATLEDAGWGNTDEVINAIEVLATERLLSIGIDAPRTGLPFPRRWRWHSRRRDWLPAGPGDGYRGRHCELVLSALGLATPQWTPVESEAKPWMRAGFALFRELTALLAAPHEIHEVFPAASYRLLASEPSPSLTINFAGFAPGPADLLDACVAAITVREFRLGHGCRVGGDDGLGAITLPRPVTNSSGVLRWPEPCHAQ